MNWLEIIELRSVNRNRELLKSQLPNLINEVDKEAKKQAIKVYSRVIVDTDFRIHLFHNSNKIDNSGSPLGLRLASALKEFGLVNHSIWVEMHSK
jgi:uncharacterized protein YicC (UPF0701 family)